MNNNQENINQNSLPGYVGQNFINSSLDSTQSNEVINVTRSDTHTVNGGIDPNYSPIKSDNGFDYTFINYPARIAIYDNMKAAPRVIEIQGGPTHEYIEKIADGIINALDETVE